MSVAKAPPLGAGEGGWGVSKGWVRGLAEWTDGDTAYLSVAFTWLLDEAYQRAVFWRAAGSVSASVDQPCSCGRTTSLR